MADSVTVISLGIEPSTSIIKMARLFLVTVEDSTSDNSSSQLASLIKNAILI